LVDNNWEKVTSARQAGYATCFGSIVSEKTHENLDLEGIGKFLALTPNKGINSLASIHFSKVFDSSNVYQIYTAPKHEQDVTRELRGKILSSFKLTYPDIEKNENQLLIKSTRITDEYSYSDFLNQYKEDTIHNLFVINKDNKLLVYSEDIKPKLENDEILISLILNKNNLEEENDR